MRRMFRRVWRLAAGTITVALFTACSPDSPTTSPNPVLTQPEANAMAEVVATDAAALSQAATFDSAAASVATTSAMAFASGWVRTGLGDVVGESGEHAVNNATVMVPAARRQTLRNMRRMRRSSDGSSTGRCEHDAG